MSIKDKLECILAEADLELSPALLDAERLADVYKDITPAPYVPNTGGIFVHPENRNQVLFHCK